MLRAGRFYIVLYVTHILTQLLTPESSLLPEARAISVRNVLCEISKEPKSAFTDLKGFGKSRVIRWHLSGPCGPSYVGQFSWKWTLRSPKTFFGAVLGRYHRELGLRTTHKSRAHCTALRELSPMDLCLRLRPHCKRSSSSIAVHNHVPQQLNAKKKKWLSVLCHHLLLKSIMAKLWSRCM